MAELTYRVQGNVVWGTSTDGTKFVFDLIDLPTVQKYRWHACRLRGTGVPYLTNSDGVMLHQLLMGFPHGKEVDHINLDILFVIVCTAFILQNFLEMYRTVIVPYANGQYEIVEGYVQNFIPMPPEGHSNEMFDIGDVHFEYSDNLIVLGYHKTKTNGGVIRGNGQYLKVGYVYFNESYGNIIVYIEEITPS